LVAPVVLPAAPASPSLPDPVDDAAFMEALDRRGLDDWLQQYLDDVPATDAVGSSLAQRERLLIQAAKPGQTVQQVRSTIEQADRILADLIEQHGDHPARLGWQFELARDYLERQCPTAFENLMLYDLPGRDAATVQQLASRAVDVLNALRQAKTDLWKSLESMDEPALAALRESGSLTMLESLDAQSAMLLAWARLYQAVAVCSQSDPKSANFAEILSEVTRTGRLDLPAGRESEQAGALLVAAICQRHLGQCDDADARARQVIAILGRITDRTLRQRLRQTALLAVLEQIRANRDAGRLDAALQAVEQARGWCLKSRSDEPAALIAVTMLEAGILQLRQSVSQPATTRPVLVISPAEWMQSTECLAALQNAANRSPVHRDLLYSVLASSVSSVAPTGLSHPFALQILLGAAVADADATRINAVIPAVRAAMAAVSSQDATSAGELAYLLGRALGVAQVRTEAVQVLADMVEAFPTHDRADAAARQAVALAGDDLRHAGPGGTPASRAAFIRAVHILRQRTPQDPQAADWTYALAAALENDSHFEDAAVEYAKVPAGHPRFRDSALGGLRCWRQALDQAGANAATVAALADKAKAAVHLARTQAATQPARSDKDCSDAALTLAAAELLNHPAVGGAADADQLLAEFETRYPACPDLLGPVLRQRIVAMRQLKQLQQARGLVDRYLAADPENAGSVMAGLLQTMHDEMLAAFDRGDAAAASTVAGEAAQLGRALLDWGADRPGRLTPTHSIVIHLWYAAALETAGRPAEALAAIEQVEPQAQDSLPADSVTLIELRLTRADALFSLDRTAEALDIYTGVWQRSAEQSSSWWHGLVGSLRCHAKLDPDPSQVLQSIRQQRFLAPDLGGGRWKHQLEAIEQSIQAKPATKPAQ
jgi:hypothetical protein